MTHQYYEQLVENQRALLLISEGRADEIEALRHEMASALVDVGRLRDMLAAVKQERDLLEADNVRLRRQVEDAKAEHEKTTHDYKFLESQLADAHDRLRKHS
jgi:chromosome segregation ATPase